MADTLHKIKCPACQKEMTKIFVPSQGIDVDICLDGCGGIYFDNREFKFFDEQNENINDILDALKNKIFNKTDESLPRTCPVCGARMVKNFSSIKKEVQIDECYACGGKFLDHGELIKIRNEYVTEEARSADIIKEIYNTVGVEIKRMENEHQEALKHRSPIKILFDYLINN